MSKVRGKTVTRKCRCGNEFEARVSDVKRGWGKFCSKSCKAKKQTKDRSSKIYKETVAGGSFGLDQDWENQSVVSSVEESQAYGL